MISSPLPRELRAFLVESLACMALADLRERPVGVPERKPRRAVAPAPTAPLASGSR